MSAYIKNLTDKNGDIVYPHTKASAIFYDNNTLLSTVIDNKVNSTDVYTKTEALNILTVDEEEAI